METSLHMQQGLNLLNRVLQFYPYTRKGDRSIVTLTEQDWLVLMDFIENPETESMRPEAVTEMSVDRRTPLITVAVAGCTIEVRLGM